MSFTVFYGPLTQALSQSRNITTKRQKSTAPQGGSSREMGQARSSLEGAESRLANDFPEANATGSSSNDYEGHRHHESISSSATMLSDLEKQGKGSRWRKKRKLIWILISILLLLVIIGAVIGGVVSFLIARRNSYYASLANANLANANSNTTDLSHGNSSIDKSGIAVIASSYYGPRYVYQQIPDGSIVEINGTGAYYQLNNATIVTRDAMMGGPLAAVSYKLNGTEYRSLAYTDSMGNVVITNITNTTGDRWSSPTIVAPYDTVITTSPALALCVDTEHINGLRLYYPSTSRNDSGWGGSIQEVGLTFASHGSGWTAMHPFDNAYVEAGVACTIFNGTNRVYYRHNTSVEQMDFDYTNSSSTWTVKKDPAFFNEVTGTAEDLPIADSSDIAAVSDKAGNDYVFYRLRDDTLIQRVTKVNATGFPYTSFGNYTTLADGYKFDAAWLYDGTDHNNSFPWLLYQPIKYPIWD